MKLRYDDEIRDFDTYPISTVGHAVIIAAREAGRVYRDEANRTNVDTLVRDGILKPERSLFGSGSHYVLTGIGMDYAKFLKEGGA